MAHIQLNPASAGPNHGSRACCLPDSFQRTAKCAHTPPPQLCERGRLGYTKYAATLAGYTHVMASDTVTASPADIARYLRNLRDEVDGAHLYRLLADAENDPRIKGLYSRMAQSEERHQALWRRKIEESGGTIPAMKPSTRIRMIGWIARRFGPGAVAPLVARMEQSAFTMYDNQPEAVEGGLPGEERGHALISREIARGGMRAADIVRVEGRHIANSGNALRAAVLGANDGLLSNLGLVMGIAGASPGRDVVLLTGFGGLLAGAISMGLGEWVSVRSSAEAFERQVSIERDELLMMPQEEADELALIYEAKGLTPADARRMAQRIVTNPESALDTLTREELGMSQQEVGNPWTAASTSAVLFVLGALVPILPWIFTGGALGVALSALFSAIGLFTLGTATSLFTGRSALFSGGRMVTFGVVAAAITFTVGMAIGGAAGI